MKIYVQFILLACLTFLGQAQNTHLDSLINQIMEQSHVTGLAACAINNGKVFWSGYYGFQNREQKKPVAQKTLFAVASTSKTVTTAALMQLYSAGKFKLTDNINHYLPFKVTNPPFPTVPITFGELLRHRSSLRDNLDYLGQFWRTLLSGEWPVDQFRAILSSLRRKAGPKAV